jgi:outer membrane lipoprotein carrier protein
LGYADINTINYFEADFSQNVTDEKGKVLSYDGHVKAARPKYAFWDYHKPVEKKVYVTPYEIVIIEPEIEQAIIKQIREDFNIFAMIKNAKKINNNTYMAIYKDSKFKIKTKENKIESISYKDELENNIVISFKNQKQNEKIEVSEFKPKIPLDYDVIQE